MVAQDSAAEGADRPVVLAEAGALRVRRWVLERKLYRRTWSDFARSVARILVIRLHASMACLISMILVTRIGACIRALSAHDWQTARTLDGTTLLAAFAQAGRYQGYLFPILLVWAAFLLLTPRGDTVAFRAAAVAAGVLGYLELAPPPFLVTAKVAVISHWLGQADTWAVGPYLVASVALAYVLHSHTVRTFRRLVPRPEGPGWLASAESPSGYLTRRLCAMPLVLLVLLLAVWATVVIRLAASGGGRESGTSYGYQAALAQGKYLFVLALIAIVVSQTTSGGRWMTAAVVLTAVYGLLTSTGPFHVKATRYFLFPSALEFSAGRAQLTRIGTAWGAGTLWAALFVFVPAIVLGIYLTARLLRSPRNSFPG